MQKVINDDYFSCMRILQYVGGQSSFYICLENNAPSDFILDMNHHGERSLSLICYVEIMNLSIVLTELMKCLVL